VQGYPDAEYKSFPSQAAAEQAFQGKYQDYEGKASASVNWLFAPEPPIADSYTVDAACSGSPGRLEYRGVQTTTGKQIFHQGPFENGTNNVGEFLALVHVLAYLIQEGSESPVYSDSETAISWVKAKKCKTELIPDEKNAPLFDLIARGEKWLAENEYPNCILKWDTAAWGEIPADFNRK
jgi:ribonuclease HI